MKLNERLNVLIQAVTLAQKSGTLNLNDAVKAKTAIDVISTGVLSQNYADSINTLVEIAAASQRKGAYTLKDAYMIFLAIDGLDIELKNEANKVNSKTPNPPQTNEIDKPHSVSVPAQALERM